MGSRWGKFAANHGLGINLGELARLGHKADLEEGWIRKGRSIRLLRIMVEALRIPVNEHAVDRPAGFYAYAVVIGVMLCRFHQDEDSKAKTHQVFNC